MLDCRLESEPQQRKTLLRSPAVAPQQDALRRESLCKHLRQRKALGHLQCGLDPLQAELGLAPEEEEPAELCCERGEVGVGFLLREQLE